MKDLSNFVGRVTQYVNGAPQPLIEQSVVDAAIAFCEDSLAMREVQDPTDTVIDQPAYALAGKTDQEVARVLNVWVDGVWLKPLPADSINYSESRSAKPTYFYTTRIGSVLKVNLYPIPDKVYSMQFEVAYRPTRQATSLEDDLFNIWVDGIVKGAAGRLMQIPGQSYTDSSNATTNMLIAKSVAMKARTDAVGGRTQVSRTVRMRPLVR